MQSVRQFKKTHFDKVEISSILIDYGDGTEYGETIVFIGGEEVILERCEYDNLSLELQHEEITHRVRGLTASLS